MQLRDTVKAHLLQPDGSYEKVDRRGKETFNSQVAFCVEAMEAAKDALLTAFDFYFEDNELIPLPSPLNSHDHFIEVPLSVASEVLLLNAFLQSEITQQELARRIGKPKQEITRLFNLHHATKIDAVQLAAKALGKELSLVMV